MNRHDAFIHTWFPTIFLAMTVLFAAIPASAQGLDTDGTWKLVLRELPDGTLQRSPEVMGLATLWKGQRNLNVVWHSADGKVASYSLMSTYSFTPTEYTETLLVSIFNDPTSGQPPIYNLSGETKTVPVSRYGARVAYKLPFDLPSVVFEGDKLTATAEGVFVDHWERVR